MGRESLLRQLERDEPWGGPGIRERLLGPAREIGVRHRPALDVDRDGIALAGHLRGAPDEQVVELGGQAKPLRDRLKAIRRDEAAVLRRQEERKLVLDRVTRGKSDDRLCAECEVIPVDRFSEQAEQFVLRELVLRDLGVGVRAGRVQRIILNHI